MAIKENIDEAEDFDFDEYVFEPREIEINGKKILDYTGIEHDKIFLVNKKDILEKARPGWIPALDGEGLRADQFLPVCVMDGDGNYFVQAKVKTGEKERVINSYTGKTIMEPVFETEYYKMSRDILAATVDYYIKSMRAALKAVGSTERVSLPRALKTMKKSRYEDMVGLLSLCDSYKDRPDILKTDLDHFSKAYREQNHIIFIDQWQNLLRAITDKKLDMNLQKQDYINTFAKGEETSYGKSGTSNALYNEFGVMIKKQNGSTFQAAQRNWLENTLRSVWNHYGDLRSLAEKNELVISYADNCNQHARKAVGLYRTVPMSGEKAIGVSFFNDERGERQPPNVILAHEATHWLDSEKGKETHHFFASDATGTLENKIAMKFKELVRDNEKKLNELSSRFTKDKTQSKLGDYWFRTCECLARAMEEHYALSQGLTIFEKNPAYLPKEQFKKEIEPLAVELIEENKKHFGLGNPELKKGNSLSETRQKLRDIFVPDEARLKKIAASYKKVSEELSSVIDGAPDTFNYLRGANRAMDNRVEAYQSKVAKLSTKKRVLELDMRLLAKLPLSATEWDELERNSASVDKDSIRLLERGSFDYYASVVTSANKNAGISLPKQVPLVLDLPAGYRLDFLVKGEDGYSVGENGGWTMPLEEYEDVKAVNNSLLENLKGLPDESAREQTVAADMPVKESGVRRQPLGLNNLAVYNLFAINNESISYFKNYAGTLYDINDTEHAKLNIGSGIVDVGPAVELVFRSNPGEEYSSYRTIYGDTKNISEWIDAYLKENGIRTYYKFRQAIKGFESEHKVRLEPALNLGMGVLDFTEKISSGALGLELKHGFEKYVGESGYAAETFVSRMFKNRGLNIRGENNVAQGLSEIGKPMEDNSSMVIPQMQGQQEQASAHGEFPGLLDESQWEEVYLKKFSSLELDEKLGAFKSELEKSLSEDDKVQALKNISGKINVNFETVMREIKRRGISISDIKENKLMETKENTEQKPYSFFVKDSAEFDAFAEFEPITGLTAKEAVSEYMNNPSSVIGVHIPTNKILNTPDGEGMWVLSRLQDGEHRIDDTFLQQGQETTRNDENFIDALSELEEECRSLGLHLSVPFVFRELQGKLRDRRLEEKAANEVHPAEPNWKQDKALLEEVKRLDRSSRPNTSIWGSVQNCHKLIPGVYLVSTAGHGGIMVHESVAEKVLSKANLEHTEKWAERGFIPFEEDADINIALVDLYRKHLLEGLSWNKGKEKEFYEYGQKSILRWNPGLLEKMNEEYDNSLSVSESKSSQLSLGNISLNNEHGEDGWQTQDMFIPTPEYITAAKIDGERFAMPVATWKPAENPEITMYMTKRLIAEPSNAEKEYLDTSINGSPTVFSRKEWDFIHTQEVIELVSEQIKNQEKAQQKNTFVLEGIKAENAREGIVKPVTLDEILGVMDMKSEISENGKILVYDEQRKEYIDNGMDFEGTGNEGYEFSDANEIFERLDTYIHDYYIHDMEEQLEACGVDTEEAVSLEDYCELYKKELSNGNMELSKGELNLAMGIVHPDTVILPKKQEISASLVKIKDLLLAAIDEHGEEHIDLVENDVGQLDIMYHSDNNSFLVTATNEKLESLDKSELIKLLDSLDVGHNFPEPAAKVPERDISSLTAAEANERCQKLGYYFEYNDDEATADIFTEEGGDWIATYGAGGFGFTDDLLAEGGASRIPDEKFRDVIALADRFYHASIEEIEQAKELKDGKTPVRLLNAQELFARCPAEVIRTWTGLDVSNPEYVDLIAYASVNEKKGNESTFIAATGTDDSRHIWNLLSGTNSEGLKWVEAKFCGKYDHSSYYNYHTISNLVAASLAAGLIDKEFRLKDYDGGTNNSYTAVRNFEKEMLPKIQFHSASYNNPTYGNKISLHEGLGFDMNDDHAIWSKEERELIAGFEQPVQEVSGKKEEETVTVSLKQLYEHYARDGKEFSHVGDNNVLTDFGRIRHTGEDGNDYYDLFNEEGVLACCDGETVTLKESKDGKNYLINEEDEYPTRFILSDEEFGIATMTRTERELAASQEPARIRLERWEVGGKTYQVRECFFEHDGKSVTRYVGEEDMANGGYPDDEMEAADERIAYYVDKDKLKTLSDDELLEYIHDNIDENIYEIFDTGVSQLKSQVSENRIFVIDGASNGMLAKYINRSEISDIEEFRKFAADRITGTAQDKTYFEQMWKAGIEFCREKGWEMPEVPEEYESLLPKTAEPEKPVAKMPEISLSEKDTKLLPFSIIENIEKKRVNIKFDTMENNPDFPEIIKTLKANGWKFAPSTKQWYPVGKAVEGAKEFAEKVQKQYSSSISEPVKVTEAQRVEQEKSEKESASVYDGILFFDRNYDEPKEFARYMGIDEKTASHILNALGHDYAELNSQKTERFGLDKDKNLVSVTSKDDGTTTLRSFATRDELVEYACENAQKEYEGIKTMYENHQKGIRNDKWGAMLDVLYDKAMNHWAENLHQITEIQKEWKKEKLSDINLSASDREIMEVIDGKLPKDHAVSLGKPGLVLQKCGLQTDIELTMGEIETRANLFRDPLRLDLKKIVGLEKALQEPVAVFNNSGHAGYSHAPFFVITKGERGKYLKSAIDFDYQKKAFVVKNVGEMNPDNTVGWLDWIRQGKMVYGNKEKISEAISDRNIKSFSEDRTLTAVKDIMLYLENDFTNDSKSYKVVQEKAEIEMAFALELARQGHLDAKEIAQTEAEEFYKALSENDTEKIAEYTETDIHEVSLPAKSILEEYRKEHGERLDIITEDCLHKGIPYVEVLYSERSGDEYLPEGKVWYLDAADKYLPELNDTFSSCLKTEIAVHFPDGDKPYTKDSCCTGTFRLDIGTDRKMESFSDYIRKTCSDREFLAAFEKAWRKNYVPHLDNSLTDTLTEKLNEVTKAAKKELAVKMSQFKEILDADNRVHSAVIIEETASTASKNKVENGRIMLRTAFGDILFDLSKTAEGFFRTSEFKQDEETQLFTKHAIKNAMIDLYYGESREAHYGSGFDFATWHGMIDSIPAVAEYDTLIDKVFTENEKINKLLAQKDGFEDKLYKAEEKLRENPENPLAAADKVDSTNAVNEINSEIKRNAKPSPGLEVHDRVGEYTVLDSFRISDGIYQATLGQMTGNGGLAAQSYFVIDNNVAALLSGEARSLMDCHGARFVIGNKLNEPYVLKELIEQKLMPPRDENFMASINAYIERHPVELARKGFFPVTLANIQKKTAELAVLNKSLAKDPLVLAKNIISMIDDDMKGQWLKNHGCNTPEGLRKTFSEWMSGAEIKKQKDNGYPPRGEK